MAGSKLCRAGDPCPSRARRRWADRHPEERPWADSRREPGARANPQAPGARTQDRNAQRRLSALPLWVFCDSTGRPLSPRTVEDAFKRVLKAAGLPPHFLPHSLRHSFASLLLQQGESPVYVQRQLGHASITLTVDLYGRWLPMGNKAAVDRLDGPSGSKTVAETVAGGAPAPEKHKESSGSIAGSGRARIIAP